MVKRPMSEPINQEETKPIEDIPPPIIDKNDVFNDIGEPPEFQNVPSYEAFKSLEEYSVYNIRKLHKRTIFFEGLFVVSFIIMSFLLGIWFGVLI